VLSLAQGIASCGFMIGVPGAAVQPHQAHSQQCSTKKERQAYLTPAEPEQLYRSSNQRYHRGKNALTPPLSFAWHCANSYAFSNL
jgi:hypothetical protein